MPHVYVWHFDPRCRFCQQKERNERKNEDRPTAIVRDRAATRAHKAGVSVEFFMVNMNYRALIPDLRTALSGEGLCHNCGEAYAGQGDVHIEHIRPPRDERDWERLHARNLRLLCGSCNRVKGRKEFDPWLEEMEAARLANEVDRAVKEAEEIVKEAKWNARQGAEPERFEW